MSPLNVFALAERLAVMKPRRRTRDDGRPSAQGWQPRSAAEAGGVDVDRLEQEGLYAGVCRNEAALALARRKMLGQGWTGEQTVDWLMEWTASRTNGLSPSAERLSDQRVADELRHHYYRITRGIERGIAQGKVVMRRGGTGHAITRAEGEWIFSVTASITDEAERYRTQVLLFCITGFAKDRGWLVEGPGRFHGTGVMYAQIPATLMQQWPFGSSGVYKRMLTWALEANVIRLVRNYRNSNNPALCRARTFEVNVDLHDDWAPPFNWDAISTVAQHASVHPRQVEHALHARQQFSDAAANKYGAKMERKLERILKRYDEVVARSSERVPVENAA